MPSKGSRQGPGRQLTPLWIISLFVSLAEAVLGVSVIKTTGGVQVALTVFFLAFPVLVAGAFFAILWSRPWVLYSPGEYGEADPSRYVDVLVRARFSIATTRTSDVPEEVEIVGEPDRFRLLFKAAGASWKKSTKAMDVGRGCVVQVTTELLNSDGSVSVAEAVTFVPDVEIVDDASGKGRYLRPASRIP